MKVLCDVHISHTLVKLFVNQGVEALHVNDMPDRWLTKDKDICLYADQQDFTVIKKDADFKNEFLLKRSPKKIYKNKFRQYPQCGFAGHFPAESARVIGVDGIFLHGGNQPGWAVYHTVGAFSLARGACRPGLGCASNSRLSPGPSPNLLPFDSAQGPANSERGRNSRLRGRRLGQVPCRLLLPSP
jgi:hypothetical protein